MKVWFNSLPLILICFECFYLIMWIFLSCSLTKFLSFTAGLWSIFWCFICEEGSICQHLKHKFVVADHDPPIVSISSLMTDPALYYINPLDLQQGLAWTANLLPSKFGGKCGIRQEAVLEPHHMKLKFVTCLY